MPRTGSYGRRPAASSAHGHLTSREVDILIRCAAGLRAREIATSLCISVRTVEYHMSTMMKRTGTESVAALVAMSYVTGVLAPDAWPPSWSGSLCLGICPEPPLQHGRGFSRRLTQEPPGQGG